jgi:hypothetical protein
MDPARLEDLESTDLEPGVTRVLTEEGWEASSTSIQVTTGACLMTAPGPRRTGTPDRGR